LYWIKVSRVAENEYRFLRSAHEHFRDIPNLGVVKPVAYIKESRAVVTEHASGEILSSQIKRRLNILTGLMGDHKNIKQLCYMCGKWLALLHMHELPSTQSYEPATLVEYVAVRLEQLVNRATLDEPTGELVLKALSDYLAMACPEDLTRVRTHGDYAPYNVLASNGDLVVHDPDVGGYFARLDNFCPRYEDIIRYLKFVRTMSSYMIRSSTRSELGSKFLEGYNDTSRFAVDESSPAFRAFLIKYKLLQVTSVSSFTTRILGEKGRGRIFRQWFEQAVAQ
jgi:hypothetical protein